MTVSADTAIGVLGVDLDGTEVSAEHDQGLQVNTRDGRAVYAKALLSAAPGALCLISPTSGGQSVLATLVSTGNIASAPGFLAINQVPVSTSAWGWFYTEHIYGRVKTLIAAHPYVPLYTTATGGVVDDTTVSTGRIQGLMIHTSATSASAPPGTWRNMVRIEQDIA